MDRTALRNLTWPLLHQPMSRHDIARGVAITYAVSVPEAESVIEELHSDIETCKRHLWTTIMPPPLVPTEIAKANAQREIAPIAAIHFEAMWRWADFIIAKGG